MTILRLNTQFDKTNDTVLADVLSVNVDAGNTYKFTVMLYLLRGANCGSKFALSGNATFSSLEAWALQYTPTGLLFSGEVTVLNSAFFSNIGGAHGMLRIEGTIVVSGSGTLTVQFAQSTSGSNTSSVLVGSFIETQQIV